MRALSHREKQILQLLIQGADNEDISKSLKMARRTVKAYFNRLFLRYGIEGGIKRVKLATTIYREVQKCPTLLDTGEQNYPQEKKNSSNSYH